MCLPNASEQVMKKDFGDLGYIMEHQIADAQWYLLRQRRNRVWATFDINSGQSAETYGADMTRTMKSMASDVQFPFSSCFDETIEPESPRDGTRAKLEEAIRLDEMDQCSGNVFLDGSTSKGRRPESAVGICACVRPTHAIYSQKLQRYVRPSEMFGVQGLWRDDFENPDEIDRMSEHDKHTQDLAGGKNKEFWCTCVCTIYIYI